MCRAVLTVDESWLHCVIWSDFAMDLLTCTGDVCMAKADMVRRRAAEMQRAARPDGFDQRVIDGIKDRMINSGRTLRAAGRTPGGSSAR